MRQAPRPTVSDRCAGYRRRVLWLLTALATPGCGHEDKIDFTSDTKPPDLRLIRPQVRKIVRGVEQPSFIESYERTSIFPKPTAYIQKWIVDIGDKVKKGDVLANLFAPELVEEYGKKKAMVVLDQERIALALMVVEVSEADVKAAQATLQEAEEILDKYQAEVERWDSEVKRLDNEVKKGVVDPDILRELTHQLKSSIAARDAAKASIERAKAELLSRRAVLARAEVDVRVKEADLKVAVSEAKYAKAWVDYLTLTAPFPGVITARNANTFDFVLPSSGDPSANTRAPDLSPNGAAAPIYVVERTDIVRVFVDVPEQDANYIHIGTKASVLARAYRDEPISAKVTRTSWALNVKSRTLRTEVDLPNPGGQLLPGMYADVKVLIEHPNIQALPYDALIYNGDQTFCWTYSNGRSLRTEIQTGVSDGEWIEVTNRRVPSSKAASTDDDPWVPIDGSEQMIAGDLSLLADGEPVRIAPASGEEKVARKSP